MKKLLTMILILVMCLSMASCGGNGDNGNGGADVDPAYAGLEPVELIGADSTGKGAAGQIFGEYVIY